MFKKVIVWKLRFFAKAILSKYKPKIIGITGSVGKTSAKEATFAVVKRKFRARQSIKNYNNEFGLPLSIIGLDSPGKSFFGWLVVLAKALKLVLFRDKDYPEILVLEMGVDKNGDMDYLLDIVKCDIGVVTTIGPSHLEQFGSVEAIQKEKGKLVSSLNKNGQCILNFDDPLAMALSEQSKVGVLTYGFKAGADVRAQNLIFKFEETKSVANLSGVTFKADYKGSMVPVVLPNVIGTAAVYAALAAIAVGAAMKMNLVEIAAALGDFDSPKGRTKLIDGVKQTMIIDDTYNASPQSSLAAIDFAKRIETEALFRKIAIFGDMLELGGYSEEGHREVGRALAAAKFDLLVLVGDRARDIGRGALESGLKEEQIFYFSNNEEAGKFAQSRLKKGDLVLVKGSQGARMEKVVKELMADPLRAKDLLIRQEKEWENR